jgi:hypothetical protein
LMEPAAYVAGCEPKGWLGAASAPEATTSQAVSEIAATSGRCPLRRSRAANAA